MQLITLKRYGKFAGFMTKTDYNKLPDKEMFEVVKNE